jgi:hypothetical protein
MYMSGSNKTHVNAVNVLKIYSQPVLRGHLQKRLSFKTGFLLKEIRFIGIFYDRKRKE